MIHVADPGDPRLDDFRGLKDRDLSRTGTFVVEGNLAVAELLASSYRVRRIVLAERRVEAMAPLLGDHEVIVAPDEVLATTVGFALHQGVLASGVRPAPTPAADVVGSGPLLLGLEGINDFENLGSLFRTARALGVTGVLLDPTCADPLYRRSIRVSLGHVLRLPFAVADPWPLRLTSHRVVALTPSGTTTLASLEPARPTVVLVGAEGPGLSAATLAAADVTVRIPMALDVDSLNVATAAGIALHHLLPRS